MSINDGLFLVKGKGPIKNQSMLRDLGESVEQKTNRLLLNQSGMLGMCNMPIGHIYAIILENAFSDNWEDFLSLEDFRIKLMEHRFGGLLTSDIKEGSSCDSQVIRYDQVDYIARMLGNDFDVEKDKIFKIILSIYEGINYQDLPKRLSEWGK